MVGQLNALRALLFTPARMQVLVAGDLSKPCAEAMSPWVLLVEAFAPPSGDYALKAKEAAEAPEAEEDEGEEEDDEGEEGEGEGGAKGEEGEVVCKPAEEIDHFATIDAEAAATSAVTALPVPPALGLATGVASYHIRTGVTGVGLICPLASIESSYVRLNAPGIAPTHDDYSALRVVIEHLTALEGDFWVKLRGAGPSPHSTTWSQPLTFAALLAPAPDPHPLPWPLIQVPSAHPHPDRPHVRHHRLQLVRVAHALVWALPLRRRPRRIQGRQADPRRLRQGRPRHLGRSGATHTPRNPTLSPPHCSTRHATRFPVPSPTQPPRMPPATHAICLARGPSAQLAGAKSSLAFNVISRTANKASAYSAAWTSAYLGVGVDHDRQLLAKVRTLAMHACIL